MSVEVTGRPCEAEEPWDPKNPAVHQEILIDDDGKKAVAMLRHASYPYTKCIPAGDDDALEHSLREVADAYLRLVAEVAQLHSVIAALTIAEHSPTGFGWLRTGWRGGGSDPRLSFWVERRLGDATPTDRTYVLLAGNRLGVDGRQLCTGMSTGLRVVMHLAPSVMQQCRVRITGLSFSGLSRARLSESPAPPWALESERAPRILFWLEESRASLAQAFGFHPAEFSITSLASDPLPGLLLAGSARRMDGELARVYTWAARDEAGTAVPLLLCEQVTHMLGTVVAFGVDPASAGPAASEAQRRPTVPTAELDKFRNSKVPVPDEPDLVGRPTGRLRLVGRDATGVLYQVLQSSVVNPRANTKEPKTVPDGALHLRSDDLAAVHAFQRGRELFLRLSLYGLQPRAYFKLASLPLLLRHRARFSSARDGNTVNAQVRQLGLMPDLQIDAETAVWPQLEVAFGAANLTHRPLLPNDDAPAQPRAQMLGLAADARWAWHEFGHVLLGASTGELEFRFAHSAGDALAAIVADPDSRLAEHADPGNSNEERMRLLTFPWVRLTRSHGRSALLGWCWCGRRSRRRNAPTALPARLFSDYFEEQLMSSALFTMYSALGGLPHNTADRRHAASHYSVYMVMRAMALLGPANVVPARSADQFVSALIDADIGTGSWQVHTAELEDPPRYLQRVGGSAHKVLRWAFEHQGLFASPDDPTANVEGEGRPPAVDIHVPGLGPRTNGGYAPVTLQWVDDPEQPAAPWHAAADALWGDSSGIRVAVRNRGDVQAQGVSVRCWVAPRGPRPLQWAALQPTGPQGMDIDPLIPLRTFTFEAPLPGQYLVLAEATCTADRSNLDPAALMACSAPDASSLPPDNLDTLTDLVAGDNNLGLRALCIK